MKLKNEYVNLYDVHGRSLGATNEWQRVPDAFDYIIFKDGDVVKAKNGRTGKIVYNDTDWAKVVQYVYDNHQGKFVSIFTKAGVYDAYSDIEFDTGVKNFALLGEHKDWRHLDYTAGTVIKFHDGKGINVTYTAAESSPNTGFAIEGLKLDGLDKAGVGIKIGDKDTNLRLAYFKLKSLTLYNFDTALEVNGFGYLMEEVHARFNNTGIKLWTPGGSGWCILNRVASTNATIGIHVLEGDNYQMYGIEVEGCDKGLYIEKMRNSEVYGLWGENTTTADVYVSGSLNAVSFFGGVYHSFTATAESTLAEVHIIKPCGYINSSLTFTIDGDVYGVIIEKGWYPATIQGASADKVVVVDFRAENSYATQYLRINTLSTNRFNVPTSAPTNPAAGDMYFDPSTGELYIYDGSAWKSITLS